MTLTYKIISGKLKGRRGTQGIPGDLPWDGPQGINPIGDNGNIGTPGPTCACRLDTDLDEVKATGASNQDYLTYTSSNQKWTRISANQIPLNQIDFSNIPTFDQATGPNGAECNLESYKLWRLPEDNRIRLTGSIFQPSQLSDLALWLRSDEVVLSGSEVTQWTDMSGNSRHATPPLTSNRPDYFSSEINGLPVLRFNGSTDSLSYDGTFLAGTDYTIFVVEGRRSSKTSNYFLGGDTQSTNNNLLIGYQLDTNFRLAQWINDLDVSVSGYPGSGSDYHYSTLILDSSLGHKIRRDGNQVASNGNTDQLISYNGARIGSAVNTIFYYNGDIAEIIMFDRALTTDEITSTETYLSKRYFCDF